MDEIGESSTAAPLEAEVATATISESPGKNIYWKLLGALSAVSLVILLILRLYALGNTITIRTWDDVRHRTAASSEATRVSTWQAIKSVALPNPNNLNAFWTIGYHSWLVLFLKLWPGNDAERIFQWTNFVMLLIQCGLLYLLGVWTTGRRSFALFVAFLYLSCPLIFGINRWVMTENHFCTALICFSAVAYWLLRPRKSVRTGFGAGFGRELLKPLLAAWVFGCFSTMREYALAGFMALLGCILLGLLLQRRWLAFLVFCAALAPYLVAMKKATTPVIQWALTKSKQDFFFSPLGDFFPFAIGHNIGMAQFIFVSFGLTLTLAAVAYAFWALLRVRRASWGQMFKSEYLPLTILWMGHWAAVAANVALIIHSNNRNSRYFLTFIGMAFAAILIGIKLTGGLRKTFCWHAYACFALLAIMSWTTITHQLFVAFEGGKKFAHHPFHDSYMNYPMHLRPLVGPDDMHVLK